MTIMDFYVITRFDLVLDWVLKDMTLETNQTWL